MVKLSYYVRLNVESEDFLHCVCQKQDSSNYGVETYNLKIKKNDQNKNLQSGDFLKEISYEKKENENGQKIEIKKDLNIDSIIEKLDAALKDQSKKNLFAVFLVYLDYNEFRINNKQDYLKLKTFEAMINDYYYQWLNDFITISKFCEFFDFSEYHAELIFKFYKMNNN